MNIHELDTPALLVDLDKLQANIQDMAALAAQQGVNLRPHTKTHKCPEIARMQLAAGAAGITCAKLGEAEVMARAGIDDILIAYEIVGSQKIQRLIKLGRKIRVMVAVDHFTTARQLNQAFADAGQTLNVLIEVNTGQNRCGVLPGEETLQLAQQISRLKNLNLCGIMTHAGHVYHQTEQEAVAEIGMQEGKLMVETADLLRKHGIAVEVISTGSTPTARYCGSVPGVTEIRPGTYVFYDLTQVNLFACTLENCALSVLSTVISRPAKNRAVLDAGKKALTSETLRGGAMFKGGYGFILEKKVTLSALSEEHGVVVAEAPFEIGEKVRIIPNHVCPVVNQFDEMYGVRGEVVERIFKIEGRGKMR